MICRSCLKRLARQWPQQAPIQNPLRAAYARSSSTVTAQTTTATDPRPHGRPAATSTSAAQPFSTALTPSPSRADSDAKAASAASKRPKVVSSVPAGTVLRGLNFVKTQSDPIALEDGEYPAWLWGVLDPSEKMMGAAGADGDGDLFSKSKKQRRKAAKSLRKRELQDPESFAPKVPLAEQSVDLPAGDGTLEGALEAAGARRDLTKAMREKRRARIKEDNFLRTMK